MSVVDKRIMCSSFCYGSLHISRAFYFQHQGESSPAEARNPSLVPQVPATHPTPTNPAAGNGLFQGAGVTPPSPAVPHPRAVAAPYTPAPMAAPAEDMQMQSKYCHADALVLCLFL